jgi:hypothetical protein
VRTFDVAERRNRLARRHRLAPGYRAPDVVTAADSVVCLHATDPATVYLSAWARVDGMTRADLDRALYTDRSLVKQLCMRRTLFVLNTELLGLVQSAAADRVAEQERRRLIKDVQTSGLYADGAGWLAAVGAETVQALGELGEANAGELRAAVPLLAGTTVVAPDRAYGGNNPVGPRVLTTLCAAGTIVRGTNRGSWITSRPNWTLTERWLGPRPPAPPEAPARAELARRWLRAFGPATVADLKWWLGSTLTATRAALAGAGAVEVDLHGSPGVALADDLDPEPPVQPWAALLPGLDPTTMGWQERGWYLGAHREQLFDRAGNGGPTAWWDGRIVGGWHQTPDGEVRLQLLEDVGADARAALEAEAGRLGGWLDGQRISPRFPSPLCKRAPDLH